MLLFKAIKVSRHSGLVHNKKNIFKYDFCVIIIFYILERITHKNIVLVKTVKIFCCSFKFFRRTYFSLAVIFIELRCRNTNLSSFLHVVDWFKTLLKYTYLLSRSLDIVYYSHIYYLKGGLFIQLKQIYRLMFLCTLLIFFSPASEILALGYWSCPTLVVCLYIFFCTFK